MKGAGNNTIKKRVEYRQGVASVNVVYFVVSTADTANVCPQNRQTVAAAFTSSAHFGHTLILEAPLTFAESALFGFARMTVTGGRDGTLNAQTSATIQPSTVQPSRIFSARIAVVLGCCRFAAKMLGRA